MICIICGKKYQGEGSLDSWDCLVCNKDSYYKIQQDINFLYKKFGYRSVYSVYPRINSLYRKQFLKYD